MIKKIAVLGMDGKIHATEGLTAAKQQIFSPVDSFIEKYGPEFYNELMPLVQEHLSEENWQDFKKYPKEVKEHAIRMMIDEGLIYWKEPEDDSKK